jgi:hypothetical protein
MVRISEQWRARGTPHSSRPTLGERERGPRAACCGEVTGSGAPSCSRGEKRKVSPGAFRHPRSRVRAPASAVTRSSPLQLPYHHSPRSLYDSLSLSHAPHPHCAENALYRNRSLKLTTPAVLLYILHHSRRPDPRPRNRKRRHYGGYTAPAGHCAAGAHERVQAAEQGEVDGHRGTPSSHATLKWQR